MTRDTQAYNTATIRRLLLAAFTPEELRRFCHDRPTFRPIVNRFGPRQRHDDRGNELITYSDTYPSWTRRIGSVPGLTGER